ncbi:BTB/POZ and MATH domain-containing protein 3-like isoform X2 [Brachypodium distachyon]|uniref:BTB domain-containing protein n=1 Tax=Brachypodium distachyon TaxID=15368 RepID=A0A2K2DMP5_BRADI|nr:BTB/POZ and MATH domain-containing protein 3-like isoform X2 [Brachypodium distachyon]PNT75547.1 hypothetical protein BRADI_1g34461v3 [Brachypodium distachyon]|eukprot:XP_024316792.1 BTB/POZ and MATH domain-containing protein 3-like isoform X2 [Brachypodium distachyon]
MMNPFAKKPTPREAIRNSKRELTNATRADGFHRRGRSEAGDRIPSVQDRPVQASPEDVPQRHGAHVERVRRRRPGLAGRVLPERRLRGAGAGGLHLPLPPQREPRQDRGRHGQVRVQHPRQRRAPMVHPGLPQGTPVRGLPLGIQRVRQDPRSESREEQVPLGGCLNVLCEVTVTQARIVEHMEGEDAAADDEEEADVKIVVGRETFAAHRKVLEDRSPAFAKDLACSTAGGGEFDDDCEVVWLRVDDMDPQVFKALLHFIYTDKLPPATNQLQVLDTAATAKQLLIAADTHKLEKLKLICEEALCKHVANNSVGAFLALAEARGLPVLRDACLEFLSSPGRLKAVVGSVNFQQLLKTGCPSALMKLIVEQLPAAACLSNEVPEETTQMNA